MITVFPRKCYVWLAEVIKHQGYRRGAEVGCAKGNTTRYLLGHCPRLLRLYAVDLWTRVPEGVGGGTQYAGWNFQAIKRVFLRRMQPFQRRVVVLEGVSWQMAQSVKDEELDFVFIDADHEYQSVVNDIWAWTPKLKPGGMLSGHDTHFEGVRRALLELIPTYQEVGVDHVWACTKEEVKL